MQIVIIGNGISGTTVARHIRQNSNHEITIISKESEFFFSRTALMYVYMGHMQFENTQPFENNFWQKNRINLLHKTVQSIDFEAKNIQLGDGSAMNYDKLILATGSKPNFFSWKGQELEGVQGLYSKQDLELMEQNSKNCTEAVVVGGGLIGVEMTEMLLSRGIKVHFLIREKNFWGSVLPAEESNLIMNHFKKHHGLQMHYQEELDEIIGENGKVSGILTKKGTKINATLVGITVGVSANVDFLKNSALEINRGILTNEFLETNIKDVYAIGDCVELKNASPGRRAIEQVWYTGRMMGEVLAKTLCGEKTAYQPGPWFNSAKFFDIEYQTYGIVMPKIEEHQCRFVWKNEAKELLLHFVFEQESRKFIGINTFGIRLRHELFDLWLRQEKSIEFILENLSSANFDPEFYKQYEKNIVHQFNLENNTQVNLNGKVWWRKLLTQA